MRDLDYVGVYFAAHWCCDSKVFTPHLVTSYARIHEVMKTTQDHRHWDIVFVSSDRTIADYDTVSKND